MPYYAQLNEENVCITISQLSDKSSKNNMVEIQNMDENYLWRKFEGGKWSDDHFFPDKIILKKDELQLILDKINRLEQEHEQTKTAVNQLIAEKEAEKIS